MSITAFWLLMGCAQLSHGSDARPSATVVELYSQSVSQHNPFLERWLRV